MSSINVQQVASSKKNIIMPHLSVRGVLGGILISLAVMITLLVAGASAGLGILDFEGGVSLTAASWGIGLWLLVSFVASLFIGSYIAGRVSGNLSPVAGSINGMAVWALMTLICFSAISSGLGKAASTAAKIPAAVGGMVPTGMLKDIDAFAMLGDVDVSLKDIEKEVDNIEAPEIKKMVKNEYAELKSEFLRLAKATLLNPNRADENLSKMRSSVKSSIADFKEKLDRDKIESLVAKNSSLSKEESEKMTEKWYAKIQSVSSKIETQMDELQRTVSRVQVKAVETADEVKNTVATTMLVFLIMLIAGLITTIFGGQMGSKDAVVVEV